MLPKHVRGHKCTHRNFTGTFEPRSALWFGLVMLLTLRRITSVRIEHSVCECVCVSICLYVCARYFSVKGSLKGQTSSAPQKHMIHLPLQFVSGLFWGSELGPLSWRPGAIWKQWCPLDVQTHWQMSLLLNSHMLLSSLNFNRQKYLQLG